MSSDERIARYLDRVCVHLCWPPYRARVRRELADHILTRAEYLQNERGYEWDEAVAQAVCLLGDPDALGRSLRQAHCPLRHIGCLFATCLLWAGIAACAVYLLLHLPF